MSSLNASSNVDICYINLANAVVLKAVDDYETERYKELVNQGSNKYKHTKYLEYTLCRDSVSYLRKFILDWGEFFTNVDGKYIISVADKRVDDRLMRRRNKKVNN